MVSSSLARHPKPGLDRDQPTLADTSCIFALDSILWETLTVPVLLP